MKKLIVKLVNSKIIRYGLAIGIALVLTANQWVYFLAGAIVDEQSLPRVEGLKEYAPKQASTFFDSRDEIMARFASERRTVVPLDKVAKPMVQAVLAAEDADFYEHGAIDVWAIARCMILNTWRGRTVCGGSTLTQQVAKNFFLSKEKSYRRKLAEVLVAQKIEERFTKDDILGLYFNDIFFGNQAYGVEEAAKIYFGKESKELTAIEAALLAGLPKAPSDYNPCQHPRAAKNRRSYVLRRMAEEGYLTRAQAEEYDKAELGVTCTREATLRTESYPAWSARRQFVQRLGEEGLDRGAKVWTTIDPVMQEIAEKVVLAETSTIHDLIMRRRKGRLIPGEEEPPQAALVAIEVPSREVRAIVGGTGSGAATFNRALDALRQPGSAMKPFVYAEGFERQMLTTTSTCVDTAIVEFNDGSGDVWRPGNWDRQHRGVISIRTGLTWSNNICAIKTIQRIGPAWVADLGHRAGINTELKPYPTLAIGTSEVRLLELTNAYATFAAGGMFAEPTFIRRIKVNGDQYDWEPRPAQVVTATTAFLVTHMMRSVVEEGTARRLTKLKRPIAGKTGTTNGYVDGWFLGYTPLAGAPGRFLVVGVWLGRDNNHPIGEDLGSARAVQIWHAFMEKALAGEPPEEFKTPPGIVFARVDPKSGLLAPDACPPDNDRVCREARIEPFARGTEPTQVVDLNAPLPPTQFGLDDAAQ